MKSHHYHLKKLLNFDDLNFPLIKTFIFKFNKYKIYLNKETKYKKNNISNFKNKILKMRKNNKKKLFLF